MQANPLRDRFRIATLLWFHSEADITSIVTRAASLLTTIVDAGGGADIACRTRGDQRVHIALLLGDRHLVAKKGAVVE